MTGCGCEYETYGCCKDGRTPARGPEQEGCGCEASEFGCCPDGITPATGKFFDGCSAEVPIISGGEDWFRFILMPWEDIVLF